MDLPSWCELGARSSSSSMQDKKANANKEDGQGFRNAEIVQENAVAILHLNENNKARTHGCNASSSHHEDRQRVELSERRKKKAHSPKRKNTFQDGRQQLRAWLLLQQLDCFLLPQVPKAALDSADAGFYSIAHFLFGGMHTNRSRHQEEATCVTLGEKNPFEKEACRHFAVLD